uniref:Calcineurin-like phosphoesterase domain-containing protein n=1 Tax=Chaetoceros debilis TaxID=122233 RepID=A0A7S3QHI5_9STRA
MQFLQKQMVLFTATETISTRTPLSSSSSSSSRSSTRIKITYSYLSSIQYLLIFIIGIGSISISAEALVPHQVQVQALGLGPLTPPAFSSFDHRHHHRRRSSKNTTLQLRVGSSSNYNYDNMTEEEIPSAPTSSPLLTFGVLADIQYAPIPDGKSFGGQPRYYRHSLKAAHHAAKHFSREEENVALVVNLGDIIDGKCQEVEELCLAEREGEVGAVATATGGESDELKKQTQDDSTQHSSGCPGSSAVDDVVEALSPYKGRILHTYGNHELYNLSRKEIGEKLQIPFVKEPCGDLVGYYSFSSSSSSRDGIENSKDGNDGDECHVQFVVLDTYDIAMMQRCPTTSRKRQLAMKILEENNPNYPQEENSPVGLEGVQKRFVAFNGGIDVPQLTWLRETLAQAQRDNKLVIILSHQPILPSSSSPVCLVWNYQDVLDIMREYKGTVAAAFAGHAHRGGYKRDEESGIHFRIFEATLESNDPIKTYGFVDVHEDCLVVRGEGDCRSAVYSLDHMDGYRSSKL